MILDPGSWRRYLFIVPFAKSLACKCILSIRVHASDSVPTRIFVWIFGIRPCNEPAVIFITVLCKIFVTTIHRVSSITTNFDSSRTPSHSFSNVKCSSLPDTIAGNVKNAGRTYSHTLTRRHQTNNVFVTTRNENGTKRENTKKKMKFIEIVRNSPQNNEKRPRTQNTRDTKFE